MNEILFFAATIISFSMVLLFYRIFGKVGMWVWMAMATIVANIEVVKCVSIFGLATTLGNIVYGSNFLATDILSEMHGEKYAKKGVWVGFAAMIASTVLFQTSLLFIPNENDFASDSLRTVLYIMPRIVASSMLCFIISNRLDIYLFQWIGKRTKHLWIKNNLATGTAQLIDSVLFNILAFAGVFPSRTLVEIIISTYIMKLLVAVLDTPFLYGARKINQKYHIEK